MDTTHDTIQRFSAYHSGDPHKVGLWGDDDGYWVTYSDHVAAVAAVRADTVDEAIRRVEGLPLDIAEWLVSADVRGVVLAALAALGEACARCGHAAHADECEVEVGYDHMNGSHECSCPALGEA